MLLERRGLRVVAVPGFAQNVHVVTRDDLELARVLAVGLGLSGGAA